MDLVTNKDGEFVFFPRLKFFCIFVLILMFPKLLTTVMSSLSFEGCEKNIVLFYEVLTL